MKLGFEPVQPRGQVQPRARRRREIWSQMLFQLLNSRLSTGWRWSLRVGISRFTIGRLDKGTNAIQRQGLDEALAKPVADGFEPHAVFFFQHGKLLQILAGLFIG